MIQRGDIIGFKKANGFRSVVLGEILRIFNWRAGNTIASNKKRHDKLAITNNLDIESQEIIQEIIQGKLDIKKHKPIVGKTIKPLYLFLDKEIILYAKLKKLKFKDKKIKDDKINKFISEMDKKHPELYHSIVNSYLEIYN